MSLDVMLRHLDERARIVGIVVGFQIAGMILLMDVIQTELARLVCAVESLERECVATIVFAAFLFAEYQVGVHDVRRFLLASRPKLNPHLNCDQINEVGVTGLGSVFVHSNRTPRVKQVTRAHFLAHIHIDLRSLGLAVVGTNSEDLLTEFVERRNVASAKVLELSLLVDNGALAEPRKEMLRHGLD